MRKQVVGIDEVGRGCWAGPLVAGAVILGNPIVGLSDSKLLSAQKRELLAEQITAGAAAYGLGWVWPSDIDASGLTESVRAAMKRAVAELQQGYDE
ncbi:MAG TPA: hypothetical protein VK983_02125, partial [Candidatus Limnocylindrales bacterium]|nr:hypothetical protein [Candidatus Limnocylindrales bacterium]